MSQTTYFGEKSVAEGQIHGIISRDEAWERWKPYGERCVLNVPIDPSTFTPDDIVTVVYAASPDVQGRIYGLYYDETEDTHFLDGLRRHADEQGLAGEFGDLVISSHQAQETKAAKLHAKLLDQEPEFIDQMGAAIAELGRRGLFTPAQVDNINNRFIAPDGSPFFEAVPMTALHAKRLDRQLLDAEQVCEPAASTNYATGAVVLPIYQQGLTEYRVNRLHERVHSDVEGSEIHLITFDNGTTLPDATAVGHFNYDPQIEIAPSDELDVVRDVELGEGWTQFVANQMVEVDPRLGRSEREAEYGDWARRVGEIQQYPEVFRAVTDAALAEVTPANPDAKQAALSRMHEIADREFGTPGSLTQLMTAKSRIHDHHLKIRS